MIRPRALFSGLVLAIFAAVPAHAHTRSQSFSTWTVMENEVRMTYTVEAREVTRLPPVEGAIPQLGELLAAHLRTHVTLLADGVPCATRSGPRPLAAQAGYEVVEWQFECPEGATLEIVNNAFFDVAPSHVHYARVQLGTGAPMERLFTDTTRRADFVLDAAPAAQTGNGGVLAFPLLGVEHIFGGVDHIAFLLTLLLLCRRPSEVLFMVTGFTLGHSVTLGLAVTGLVQPNVPVIEALIAFTIAIVAVENLVVNTGSGKLLSWTGAAALATFGLLHSRLHVVVPAVTLFGLALFSLCYLRLNETREHAARVRPCITVLFGLIHGFGFANVLLDMQLPRERILACLFGFNVGVEIGQLVIVGALWGSGLLVATRLSPRRRSLATEFASAALCALGVFWFVSRSFG